MVVPWLGLYTSVWWDFSLRNFSALDMSKSQGVWAHLDPEPFILPLRGRMNYLVILKEGTKFPQPCQGSLFPTCLTEEQRQQSLMPSGGCGVGTAGLRMRRRTLAMLLSCVNQSFIHSFVPWVTSMYLPHIQVVPGPGDTAVEKQAHKKQTSFPHRANILAGE